jgi:DnaA family protein
LPDLRQVECSVVPPSSPSIVSTGPEQFVLDLVRPEPPSFDNFVAGNNREPIAALRALCASSLPENGILLWGAAGAGKSHLLRAAAARAATLRPVIDCATPHEAPSIGDVPQGALVVVDALDVAGPVEQGRLFTLINQLPACGGQWLAAATLPPASLALRDDLRTRVALGLVFEITSLADPDKSVALAAYAHERGFRLSDDVIAYLLAHGRRDMPTLVATLAALDRHSLATRRPVTVPMLRGWLQRDRGLSG